MNTRVVTLLGSIAACGAACGPSANAKGTVAAKQELAAREARFSQKLSTLRSDSAGGVELARWVLPHELSEISGLAVTHDGRVLAHGDDEGRVYALDARRGILLKRFSIGQGATQADFEGITIADGTIYMIASNGVLYEFEEGHNGDFMPYLTHDLKLGKECEFEGVAYDSARASLVLPCKTVRTKKLRDDLVIYRWALDPATTPRISMLAVPVRQVVGSNGWTSLRPSDITIDPFTGNYVMVAAKESALIEITPSGDLVQALPLPGKHDQAEGVAITRDSLLIVSDEARRHPAAITVYRWPLTRVTAVSP